MLAALYLFIFILFIITIIIIFSFFFFGGGGRSGMSLNSENLEAPKALSLSVLNQQTLEQKSKAQSTAPKTVGFWIHAYASKDLIVRALDPLRTR